MFEPNRLIHAWIAEKAVETIDSAVEPDFEVDRDGMSNREGTRLARLDQFQK